MGQMDETTVGRTGRNPSHAGAFDPEKAERIVHATRNGATRRASAAAGPCSTATLYEWIKIGRLNPETPEAEFVRALDEAGSAMELHAILLWQSHFPKDWRAIADFLSRHPATRDDWRREPLQISGPDGGAVQISMEERAEKVVEQLESYLRGVEDGKRDEKRNRKAAGHRSVSELGHGD